MRSYCRVCLLPLLSCPVDSCNYLRSSPWRWAPRTWLTQAVRTSEKKTRIVNVHQQLTCGEQRCTTVIVDGNTRATVATEQGDRKGSSKSLAALTAQKGASSCPATLTSGGGGNTRSQWRKCQGKKQKCRPSNHDCAVFTYHCFVCLDNELQLGRCTVLCGAETSLRHLFLSGRSCEAGPQH